MIGAVRRNTELGLLVLSTLVTVGAYVLASLAEDAEIPSNIGPFLVVVVGLQIAAHVGMRRLAPRADGMLLPLATLLSGLGYVFIVRVDEARAEPDGLAGLQSMWLAVGVAAFL
ncbi:MAG TPA: FtsW/RodA/SpoVE family cell cycle protein, partial [Acidimicrobiales bacterium]